MDRVFGAYFHAFNKNEDLYRQPSLNGNYTLYETDYGQRTLLKPSTNNWEVLYVSQNGNAGALYDSKLQNV